MKHKQKVKLAKKLLTGVEKKKKVPIFQSNAWEARKEAIAKRVEKVQAVAHARALERKEKLKLNKIIGGKE